MGDRFGLIDEGPFITEHSGVSLNRGMDGKIMHSHGTLLAKNVSSGKSIVE